MKEFTTNYKTSRDNGTVSIIKKSGFQVSFDGSEFVGAEAVTDKKGIICLIVNLKKLSAKNILNAPAQDVLVAIQLPNIKSTKEITDFFTEKATGRFCGDGAWRSFKEISTLNYSQKVLAGE